MCLLLHADCGSAYLAEVIAWAHVIPIGIDDLCYQTLAVASVVLDEVVQALVPVHSQASEGHESPHLAFVEIIRHSHWPSFRLVFEILHGWDVLWATDPQPVALCLDSTNYGMLGDLDLLS